MAASSKTRVSRRLDVLPFSRKLVETGDLDPIYGMLNRAHFRNILSIGQLRSWLVTYWMFYHAGVASRSVEQGPISGPAGYWRWLENHFDNLPRGTERRHFRGDSARAAIRHIKERFGSAGNFASDLESGSPSFAEIARRARCVPQFGPWIAFKIADMLDQCRGVSVDWDVEDLIVYGSPISGAIAACDAEGWTPSTTDREALGTAFANLGGSDGIGRMQKPWNTLRMCGIPEVETCLCKWHSHIGGHYPIGKDIREIRHALDGWGPTADKLRELLPPEVEDDREDEPGRV